jgi:hypothetical protein
VREELVMSGPAPLGSTNLSGFPASPQILKAGLVLLDPVTGQPQNIIVLQYNPDQLHRTLQVQATSGEGGERSEALRIKGPPIETIKIEAEIDATDQLADPDTNAVTVQNGIHPQLAVLELMIHPSSLQIMSNLMLSLAGAVEIVPMQAPLAVFVWSRSRIVPVRVTEFSITEEAFDIELNPIRAKVSLGMRVLSVNDLGFEHRGSSLYMSYLGAKQMLAAQAAGGALGAFGLEKLP